MNESVPPQGSDLSVPVDLIDLDPPSGAELNAPSAKKARLKYQQPSSFGSSATGRPPERLWNLVKQEASQLSKLALRLMRVSVNAAGCERSFSQMGLIHTKLRNRLGWAKTTHIAQLKQELHRDRPKRKRARVVTAVDSAKSAATDRSTAAEDSLMDVETLTSATEFRLTVNEWLADIDAKETQAAGFNLAAYMDSPAVVKAPLSSIFGSALLPLLDDDTVNTY
ncbi:TPA: hypothetical protein ACH3X1_013317 [Trebouxia sp. C0004]